MSNECMKGAHFEEICYTVLLLDTTFESGSATATTTANVKKTVLFLEFSLILLTHEKPIGIQTHIKVNRGFIEDMQLCSKSELEVLFSLFSCLRNRLRRA